MVIRKMIKDIYTYYKGVRALRGYFGPLWSPNLKIAYFDWFIRRITKVLILGIYLNFTVALVSKMANKIGLKQRNSHFRPNLRLLEIDVLRIRYQHS